MLSRFFLNPTRHLRLFTRTLSSHFHPSASVFQTPHSHFVSPSQIPNFGITQLFSRHFSSNNDDNSKNGQKPTSDFWKITPEIDDFGSVFGNEDGGLTGISELANEEGELKPQESSWAAAKSGDGEGDVFQGVDKELREKESGGSADDWLTMEGFKTWDLKEEEKVKDVFDIGDVGGEAQVGSAAEHGLEKEKKTEDDLLFQKEEEALLAVLKGPNRTFGDLVAASGITDAMLDSLVALKDFQTVDGLPPLTEIEDKHYENSLKKSSRYDMELQKQEEAAKARVRQVDEQGRAYGTGRRKCSIARVWIQPGEGKFLVNDKEFDVYFPMLDHRAALLRPFSETQTLGLWDIKCTVKGGGVSGQVGAIRLGISRALQNWEPGLRPPLREAGFLTRDPRVVERKKPGKPKARKSFQWVKR